MKISLCKPWFPHMIGERKSEITNAIKELMARGLHIIVKSDAVSVIPTDHILSAVDKWMDDQISSEEGYNFLKFGGTKVSPLITNVRITKKTVEISFRPTKQMVKLFYGEELEAAFNRAFKRNELARKRAEAENKRVQEQKAAQDAAKKPLEVFHCRIPNLFEVVAECSSLGVAYIKDRSFTVELPISLTKGLYRSEHMTVNHDSVRAWGKISRVLLSTGMD